MANDPREDIVIDPTLFFVPDDVIDVRASNPNDPDVDMPVEYTEDESEDSQSSDEVTPVEDSSPDTPQTPQWLTIVSQEVRVAPDGRSVIDVTLECEDVAGAINYELRVVK